MSPTWIDWLHAIAAGAVFVWAFFSWIVRERLSASREALKTSCWELTQLQRRLDRVQVESIQKAAELSRTIAALTAENAALKALSGENCEGSSP